MYYINNKIILIFCSGKFLGGDDRDGSRFYSIKTDKGLSEDLRIWSWEDDCLFSPPRLWLTDENSANAKRHYMYVAYVVYNISTSYFSPQKNAILYFFKLHVRDQIFYHYSHLYC